jgi:hypothetical protein
MPANYVLLEKITVGAAGASSVTFSNIPQTGYTDLVVKYSLRNTSTNPTVIALINGSASGFTRKYFVGSGTAVNAGSDASNYIGYGEISTDTASTFASNEMYITNYTSSNYKSISIDNVTENNSTTAYAYLGATLWSNTAAITSIELSMYGGNLAQYSTFYLYGVAKLGTTPAIVPYATGGDTIMTDGTYWYHAFKASGTFTPAKGLSCDVLVVAGGGSGGSRAGGGGGAGGLRVLTSQSLLASSNYTATIGAGGTKVVSIPSNRGNTGTASSFSGSGITTINSSGGGGGGVYPGTSLFVATTGGSGGGGGSILGSTSGAGAAGNSGGYSPVEGYLGGNGASGAYHGGGGGGAGGAGANADNSAGGTGGAGSNTYSSWLSATGTGVSGYIAGGGGGCSGGVAGTGGGGTGSDASTGNAFDGTANTGGGGGGARNAPDTSNVYSGAGGSGLVIVRYAI